MAYFWPLILVVASNSVYHICAKSLPESVDPLASLTVTYLIGSIFSGILYFVTNRGGANLLHEYSQMNWAPYLLGLAVVGLEAGSMHAYKAGQRVSGVVCGGHRDDFGVHWVSCLPRGHHGQQARGPCAVPCRAIFPQQMSCAAAFAVV